MFTILPNYSHYTSSGGSSTASVENVVYTTGDQTISGIKTFDSYIISTGIRNNTNLAIDTRNRFLVNSLGKPRYDWQNNTISGTFFSDFLAADFDDGKLYDTNGNTSIDWIVGKILSDNSNIISLDWGNRRLSGNWNATSFTIDDNTVQTGLGQVNYIPIFINSGSGLSSSIIYQSGSAIGIGTTVPMTTAHISGRLTISNGSLPGDVSNTLTVVGAGNQWVFIDSRDNAGSAGIKFRGAGDRGWLYATNGYNIYLMPNASFGGGHFIIQATGGTGRVAINNQAPITTLDVSGDILAKKITGQQFYGSLTGQNITGYNIYSYNNLSGTNIQTSSSNLVRNLNTEYFAGKAWDDMFPHGDISSPNNASLGHGIFIPEIHNILYNAGERCSVSGSGFTSFNSANLFNGDYEVGAARIPVSGTGSIYIDISGYDTQWLTYTQGYIYISFYADRQPSGISGAIKLRDGSWINLTSLTGISDSPTAGYKPSGVCRLSLPATNYLTAILLTFYAKTGVITDITEIEYLPSRYYKPEMPLPLVNKYDDAVIFADFTFKDSSRNPKLVLSSLGNVTASGFGSFVSGLKVSGQNVSTGDLIGTGQALQTSINAVSGNLGITGANLYSYIVSLSGASNNGAYNIVYRSGDQLISGKKIFADLPTFNSGFYFGSGVNQYKVGYDNIRFQILTTGGTIGAQWNAPSAIWDFNGTLNIDSASSSMSSVSNTFGPTSFFNTSIVTPVIYDSSEVGSINLDSNIITDLNSASSIKYLDRVLVDNGGVNTTIDWNNKIISGNWNVLGSIRVSGNSVITGLSFVTGGYITGAGFGTSGYIPKFTNNGSGLINSNIIDSGNFIRVISSITGQGGIAIAGDITGLGGAVINGTALNVVNNIQMNGTTFINQGRSLVNLGGIIRAGSSAGLSLQSNAGSNTWMYVSTNGNVGVHNTSPISHLDVSGYIYSSGGMVLTAYESGMINNKIDSISGWVNNTSRVSSISVTGFGAQTGIVRISGVGNVVVHTGVGNFIYISGAGGSSSNIGEYNIVYQTGNQSITGNKYFSGLVTLTGIGYQNITKINLFNDTLKDLNNIGAVDWDNRNLLDTSEVSALNWQNRTTQDNGDTLSINWNSRLLHDTNGDQSLDWNNKIVNGAWSISGSSLVPFDVVNSLSGWTNNISRVSSLQVTGTTPQTGAIKVSGLGTVTVLTGINNFVYISGANSAGVVDMGAYNVVYTTGNQNIDGTKIFSGVIFTGSFSGIAITGYDTKVVRELSIGFTGDNTSLARIYVDTDINASIPRPPALYIEPPAYDQRITFGTSSKPVYALNCANVSRGIENLTRLTVNQYVQYGAAAGMDISGVNGGAMLLSNPWSIDVNGDNRNVSYRESYYDNTNHASIRIINSRTDAPSMIVYGYSGGGGPKKDILQLRQGQSKTLLSTFNSSGYLGIANTSPTALLHIGAGANIANSGAPIKLTSGTLLASPEKGAIEYDGTGLYITNGFDSRGYISPIVNTNIYTQSTGANICNINWASGNTFHYTLSGNTNFNFIHDKDGQTVSLAVRNTGSNGGFNFYTCSWPASVRWSYNGSVAPSQTSGAFTDVYTFIKMGTGIFGNVVQSFPNF